MCPQSCRSLIDGPFAFTRLNSEWYFSIVGLTTMASSRCDAGRGKKEKQSETYPCLVIACGVHVVLGSSHRSGGSAICRGKRQACIAGGRQAVSNARRAD